MWEASYDQTVFVQRRLDKKIRCGQNFIWCSNKCSKISPVHIWFALVFDSPSLVSLIFKSHNSVLFRSWVAPRAIPAPKPSQVRRAVADDNLRVFNFDLGCRSFKATKFVIVSIARCRSPFPSPRRNAVGKMANTPARERGRTIVFLTAYNYRALIMRFLVMSTTKATATRGNGELIRSRARSTRYTTPFTFYERPGTPRRWTASVIPLRGIRGVYVCVCVYVREVLPVSERARCLRPRAGGLGNLTDSRARRHDVGISPRRVSGEKVFVGVSNWLRAEYRPETNCTGKYQLCEYETLIFFQKNTLNSKEC